MKTGQRQNPTRGGGVWEPRFLATLDAVRCTGCGFCQKVCPAAVFEPMPAGRAVPGLHLDLCWGCTVCERMCKDGALRCLPAEARA
ncbi:MAG TPA: 4Fe-4S binding protein [Candidatus Ozemobacteraceae bacterium]